MALMHDRGALRPAALALLLLLPLAGGCDDATSGGPAVPADPGHADASPDAAKVAPEDPAAETAAAEALLHEAAVRLWTARVADDFATIWDFYRESERGDLTEAEYLAWAVENEPFRFEDPVIAGVAVQGPIGWVDVTSTAAYRKLPTAEPQRLRRWEKWLFVGGRWHPAHVDELPNLPAPPIERDAAAEAEIARRFDASWAARHARDWGRLYAFVEPADRAFIAAEEFAATLDQVLFDAAKRLWVEATPDADQARVRVAYHLKTADPSMSKAPYVWKELTETWVLVDGAWYWDVAAAPPAPGPQPEPQAQPVMEDAP